MIRIRALPLLLCLGLAACGSPEPLVIPPPAGTAPPTPIAAPSAPEGAARTPRNFARVAARVEPVAENLCREQARGAPAGYCDFVILFEDDPRAPANAFQTRGPDGRPLLVVTAALLEEMRSDDEIAFVLAHESAHHIAEHLSRQQQSRMLGALVMGGIVAASGVSTGDPVRDDAMLRRAMEAGAFVGGRAYSQDYEFEADYLGAFIAARAGYDPERGAAIFGRPALASGGGPAILVTHPASAERRARVAAAAAEIRRQQAAGRVPSPG